MIWAFLKINGYLEIDSQPFQNLKQVLLILDFNMQIKTQ